MYFIYRGVFRMLSNFCDGVLLQRQLKAFSCWLFLQKSSIIDIWQGLTYAFAYAILNFLNTNTTKWSKTLKQFFGKLPTNCLSVFDHFVGLALKGLGFSVFQIVWADAKSSIIHSPEQNCKKPKFYHFR